MGLLAEEDYKRTLGELMDLEKDLEHEIMLGTLSFSIARPLARCDVRLTRWHL
jgi:hypothetical protein